MLVTTLEEATSAWIELHAQELWFLWNDLVYCLIHSGVVRTILLEMATVERCNEQS